MVVDPAMDYMAALTVLKMAADAEQQAVSKGERPTAMFAQEMILVIEARAEYENARS